MYPTGAELSNVLSSRTLSSNGESETAAALFPPLFLSLTLLPKLFHWRPCNKAFKVEFLRALTIQKRRNIVLDELPIRETDCIR